MDLSAKTVYLICYDIGDPSRLRHVHKILLGFGVAIQLSVFRCDLSPRELVKLREKLRDAITLEDRVLFADLGPADGKGSGKGNQAISVIGAGDIPQRNATVI